MCSYVEDEHAMLTGRHHRGIGCRADVRRLSRRENTMNLATVKRHSERRDRFGQHDRLVKVLNPETWLRACE